MIKNFVVELIETLSPSEAEELRFFLESPFFNRTYNSASLVQLFDILLAATQDESVEMMEKASIFQALYPGKLPVLENKIDKLFSELKGLMQTFLSVREYLAPENELPKSLDLLKGLRLKRLDSRYQQALEKLKKQTAEMAWESIDDLHLLHNAAVEEHEWQSANNKSKGDLNIPEVIRRLDNFYVAQRTEMLNRLLLQHRISILPPSAQETIDAPWEIRSTTIGQSLIIDISWEIHRLLKEKSPQVEGYYKLLGLLQERQDEIEPKTLILYYTYLRNVCSFMINAGQKNFHGILHEINKDNLARGYFYFNDKITPHAYLNITQIALSVKETAWANGFVEAHKNRVIAENDSEEFYLMNKALCLFSAGKFEEALEIIPFGSSYSFYHLLARRMELKIYYELDSELLPYKIDAFKMFISRAGAKLLPEDLHELHVNFINFLRQLSHLPELLDKTRSAMLIKRISEKPHVAERAWLLEKAQALSAKNK